MKLHFKTNYRWKESNLGEVALEGRPALEVAPPPVFKGPEGMFSPEDFFVSAVETCFFLTLVFEIKRANVKLLEYESKADGLLERVDGQMRFTQVDLYPKAVIEGDPEEMKELMERAEKGCLVAHSISCPIHLHPEVTVASPAT